MMNKQDILKKIGGIINELNEQHQYLSNTSKINILELELFTANADFLIDHIEILKKLNDSVPEHHALPESSAAPLVEQPVALKEEEEETFELEEEEAIPEENEPEYVEILSEESAQESEEIKDEEEELEVKEDLPSFKFDFEEPTEMAFDFEKKLAVQEVFDRTLSEEEQNVLDIKQAQENPQHNKNDSEILQTEEAIDEVPVMEEEQENMESVPKEEIAEPNLEPAREEPVIEVFQQSTPITAPTPVAAQPEERKLSLNELLSEKNKQKEGMANFGRPISDLKSSVSLNDKMIFIRELFNGYNLAYSEAIEILNRFESFEAADNFLMKNYAEKNNWAQKEEIVARFYDILGRKFGS